MTLGPLPNLPVTGRNNAAALGRSHQPLSKRWHRGKTNGQLRCTPRGSSSPSHARMAGRPIHLIWLTASFPAYGEDCRWSSRKRSLTTDCIGSNSDTRTRVRRAPIVYFGGIYLYPHPKLDPEFALSLSNIAARVQYFRAGSGPARLSAIYLRQNRLACRASAVGNDRQGNLATHGAAPVAQIDSIRGRPKLRLHAPGGARKIWPYTASKYAPAAAGCQRLESLPCNCSSGMQATAS
jgi:hypothetical protein